MVWDGTGYVERGQDVTLVVPGRTADRQVLPTATASTLRAEVAALLAAADVALAPGPHETFGLAANKHLVHSR